MSITETAPALPLSAAFKEGSRLLHDEAESATFIEELMGGKLNLFGYVNYLKSLRVVYTALEETARAQAADPIFSVLHDERLERLAALDADIATLSTGAPEEDLCQHEVATEYAARIREAGNESGVRLVAHHYTRYLGDLSGGLAIGRIVGRTYGITEGLDYYSFADITAKTYKDTYRENLDNLPLDEEQREIAVDEVQKAFIFNQRMFAELGKHLDVYRVKAEA
ncbi:heme oxygenase (biliverdin-producing) [Nocardioides yefusunii]|uniref:heme oxygenase (biliverdin-producing) n=1 Tax=Nocardioides yefusunii TaxID=2500546 RepID=A0ABW1QXW7_9ACTN|nr:biliverdin-producing heme oxygenase [Nocardioides yefusunii]